MKSGLITKNWTFGSHDRRSFVGHLIGTKLLYRGLLINRGKYRCVFEDAGVESLLKIGKITPEMKEKYYNAAISLLTTTDILQSLSNEKLVWELHKLKVERLGIGTVREGEALAENTAAVIDAGVSGIDDGDRLGELSKKRNVLFYVSEFPFVKTFTEEVKKALSLGKQVAVIAADNSDGFIPTAEELREAVEPLLSELSRFGVLWISVEKTYGCMDFSKVDTKQIPGFDPETWYLRGFGEDAMMCARNLTVDAVIDVVPTGIPTRAVCNQFFGNALSRVYVPAEYDIIPYVPLVTPSKLTFYHLSYLRKQFGEKVYRMKPEELYALEGGLFFDFYGGRIPYEIEKGFSVPKGESVAKARCCFVEKKFHSAHGLTYRHFYLDKDTLEECEEDYEPLKPQHKILVDLAVAGTGASVTPVNFESNRSPREYLAENPYRKEGLMTNFSFFFTNRLRVGYNAKREDRPFEQLPGTTGYIDYYRFTDDAGFRHETFPLYRKSAIAKTKEGRYLAFRQELTGGTVTFGGGVSVSFTEQEINPKMESLTEKQQVAVFTPMYSARYEDAPLTPEELVQKANSYAEPVGKGRLNLLIIGEQVRVAREGDVLLSPIGVVLSLAGAKAAEMRTLLAGPESGKRVIMEEDGYFNLSGLTHMLSFTLQLNAPEGIPQKIFDRLEWVYGGLLGLIRDGQKMTAENYQKMLREDGWMTPLSIETQESKIHMIALHPRTAVGVTRKGEFFTLVLSGRSNVSEGADYFDICRIAEKLIPDIDFLINGDGGGSSFMAYVKGDRLTELNYTAPSEKSIAGLVRPVSSILLLK